MYHLGPGLNKELLETAVHCFVQNVFLVGRNDVRQPTHIGNKLFRHFSVEMRLSPHPFHARANPAAGFYKQAAGPPILKSPRGHKPETPEVIQAKT